MPRNRIVEMREVPASALKANPSNWRVHPPFQKRVMGEIFEAIGNVDVLKAVETPDGLILIDGHLRAEVAGDEVVTVAVLDLDAQEQAQVLATFDPLAAMAQRSQDAYLALASQIENPPADIARVLEAVANDSYQALTPLPRETTDADAEWQGMPEFEQDDIQSWRKVIVHFRNQDDLDAFAALVQQTITDHTRYLWFPEMKDLKTQDIRFIESGESDES